MMNTLKLMFVLLLRLSLWIGVFSQVSLASPYDGTLYDSTAYTECKEYPEKRLYNGGLLKDYRQPVNAGSRKLGNRVSSPEFLLKNLTQGPKYSFSSWIKINGANSALIRASLTMENSTYKCIGSVIASSGCWSFLKGGFVLNSPSNSSVIKFQSSDGKDISISVSSASLQLFTDQQWRMNQDYRINMDRKRAVNIHVSDMQGNKVQGAQVLVQQISNDFPFGSAISETVIGNSGYQEWFKKRFSTTVFENELKWYATEPQQGKVNYTIPDKMLEFVRANGIVVRGHNIFWEDPIYTPAWVLNLTRDELHAAVRSRIQSLMTKYKEEFIHWDVNNEMLHFDFYEQRLGPNATLDFFKTVHESDPLATLFMNDFNIVETCGDVNSTVDSYILKLKELKDGGVTMAGIGLEGHFSVPNPPLMRAVLDKFATLGIPIWLTEVDISKTIDKQPQAIYLEQVLREGFSHPSVDGIMLWTALHPHGCYQMCLTDDHFHNLPAGDVVDKLLQEWRTEDIKGQTDEHGSYSFPGFLGEYSLSVNYKNKTVNSTFSLSRGYETKHVSIRL